MTILNLMLGKGHGGLEQACADYAEALDHAGFRTLTVTAPLAWVNSQLSGRTRLTLRHWNAYDPFAVRRLHNLAEEHGATAVICHGNRALQLALFALKGQVPIIATAHNYSVERFVNADRILCISQDLMREMARRGIPGRRTVYMPNMVRVPVTSRRSSGRDRPTISAMGRFVEKKGFNLFIDAVRILKDRGLRFHAQLGGDGETAKALRKQAAGLEDVLTFTGWVQDKSQFFGDTDIFVLPSNHEPFGIVLLEAMAHGVPVVTTDSEGPREIVHSGHDALVVPRGDASALADAIASLLADSRRAEAMAAEAHRTVSVSYGVGAMAERLTALLTGDLKLTAIARAYC